MGQRDESDQRAWQELEGGIVAQHSLSTWSLKSLKRMLHQ